MGDGGFERRDMGFVISLSGMGMDGCCMLGGGSGSVWFCLAWLVP